MFYAAVGAVTGLTSDFKIDLVDISGYRDSLYDAIRIKGLEILIQGILHWLAGFVMKFPR